MGVGKREREAEKREEEQINAIPKAGKKHFSTKWGNEKGVLGIPEWLV